MRVQTAVARLLAFAAVASLVALTACSDQPDTLDRAATEGAVGRAVAADVAPSVTATRCPSERPREVGGTFTCKVTLEADKVLPVDVRQVDAKGALDVTPAAAVVFTERIVKELTAALKKEFGRSFTVRCDGETFEIRPPDSRSACRARDKTSSRKVTVTVTDAAGTLAFAVARAG